MAGLKLIEEREWWAIYTSEGERIAAFSKSLSNAREIAEGVVRGEEPVFSDAE